jgi:hypothetical protein
MTVSRQELQDVASAATSMQVAILWGMINAGIVDRAKMRDWLHSVIESVKDEEKQQTFAFCLQKIVDSLDREMLSDTMPFRRKH